MKKRKLSPKTGFDHISPELQKLLVPAKGQQPMTDERNSTMMLRDRIKAIPTREEPLSGQRFKYVKLCEVLDAIDAHLYRDAVVSDGIQARYRVPGEEWSSWGHVVNGVKGHEMELRATPESLASREVAVPDGWKVERGDDGESIWLRNGVVSIRYCVTMAYFIGP